MFDRLRKIFCPRIVNFGFVCISIAACFGCPEGIVMAVSAGLYALLVLIG